MNRENTSIRAMVMSAGAGTRLKPLTLNYPKPMVPIANKPVLEIVLEGLKKHNINSIAMNLHHQPSLIRDYFKDGSRRKMSIIYSHEKKLMGTAGGVKKLETFLSNGTFLVLSGDGLHDVDLTKVLDFHKKRRALATMVLKRVDYRFEYGVTMTDRRGKIVRFLEKPNWSDVFANTVNTGIYVFEPEIFKYIPKGRSYDFGHEVWPDLLSKKKEIYGYITDAYWCDVGNLKEYRKAQIDVISGKVSIQIPGKQIRPQVWVGNGTKISPGAKLKPPCVIGEKCRIGEKATIGPFTIIGNNSVIGEKSVLRSSTLWNRVKVLPHVHLENCVIGYGAEVRGNISMFEAAVINIKS